MRRERWMSDRPLLLERILAETEDARYDPLYGGSPIMDAVLAHLASEVQVRSVSSRSVVFHRTGRPTEVLAAMNASAWHDRDEWTGYLSATIEGKTSGSRSGTRVEVDAHLRELLRDRGYSFHPERE